MKKSILPSLAVLALASTLLSSCVTRQNNVSYFQNIEQIPASDWSKTYNVAPRIQPNDELSIVVSALDKSAVAAFNKPGYIPMDIQAKNLNTQTTLQTYLVDQQGCIDFPILGQLQVSGLNTMEIRDLLSQKIAAYVQDPQVTVNLLSFSVSVMGEVQSPGQSNFVGNRATLLEAITMRGDLTIYGDRTNVLLIRENAAGEREYHHLDLTKADVINSPYYYLKQNDVIYVSPNEARRSSSRYNNMKQQNLSVISTVVSALSVITSLIIAFSK